MIPAHIVNVLRRILEMTWLRDNNTHCGPDDRWHVIKYLIHGVPLYAVERTDGRIEKYCDELTRAVERVKELNNQ